jgi:hypothetical protein
MSPSLGIDGYWTSIGQSMPILKCGKDSGNIIPYYPTIQIGCWKGIKSRWRRYGKEDMITAPRYQKRIIDRQRRCGRVGG